MTPEDRQLLVETRQLVEENTAILRGMQKSQRMGTVLKVIYWAVIIVMSFGAFYLIQPYINSLQQATSNISGQ